LTLKPYSSNAISVGSPDLGPESAKVLEVAAVKYPALDRRSFYFKHRTIHRRQLIFSTGR
jgi:hypothetical protein